MTNVHEMRVQSLDLALKHYKTRDLECVLALAGVFFEFIGHGRQEIDQEQLYFIPDCEDADAPIPILTRLREAIENEG